MRADIDSGTEAKDDYVPDFEVQEVLLRKGFVEGEEVKLTFDGDIDGGVENPAIYVWMTEAELRELYAIIGQFLNGAPPTKPGPKFTIIK